MALYVNLPPSIADASVQRLAQIAPNGCWRRLLDYARLNSLPLDRLTSAMNLSRGGHAGIGQPFWEFACNATMGPPVHDVRYLGAEFQVTQLAIPTSPIFWPGVFVGDEESQ